MIIELENHARSVHQTRIESSDSSPVHRYRCTCGRVSGWLADIKSARDRKWMHEYYVQTGDHGRADW
ncbi:hypothetical protein SEA_GODONK_29 [Gordonia phage GodonK]|uniref:Uncharacterized protein n=1 Tax=Gordonia phage GodonK TaxID=2562192 RepID=A0A4D6E1Z0_9CAUD|nr:hypothetical protein HOV33_gp029 [Gordonia phage GodonK]QBZ72648.1 hypothetical protein SEA_GODONK_29 [Gordonia phage GodonK]